MTETPSPDAGRLELAHHLLLEWYRQQGRDLPWRATSDPYAILVSEMMLQQTQVDRVLPKYREFLMRFPTLEALAEASTAEVIRAWAPLGYNMRAVRLQAIARQVVADYGGKIPAQVDELLKLKGVGRYTAGAIACFAHRQPVATVDTNIRRVLSRLFVGIETPDAPQSEAATWKLAEAALPSGRAYQWNQALMDMGATICTATAPACETCPMQQVCAAYQEVGQHTLFPSGQGLRDVLQYRRAKVGRQERPTVEASELLGAETARAERPVKKVAEAPVPYKTQPFTSTNRYFRGRMVDALRNLLPGERMTLLELGPQVKTDFGTGDLVWLYRLAQELARDGLLAFHPTPETSGAEAQTHLSGVLVSLP